MQRYQSKQFGDCLARLEDCLEMLRSFAVKNGCNSVVVLREGGRRFCRCLENVLCDRLAIDGKTIKAKCLLYSERFNEVISECAWRH